MKKPVLISAICLSLLNTGCSSRQKLLLLNWGEYINEDLVEQFEQEYNCDVVISLADSNELFYQKVKSGTTIYDLVIPSDYMIEKMEENKLLDEINFDLLENYDGQDDSIFMDGLMNIKKNMGEELNKYFVPYFWGTFGLMYNNRISGLKEAVESNGWKALFEDGSRPSGTRTGMYNIPRFAYAASLFYAQELKNSGTKYLSDTIDPNSDNDTNFNIAKEVLGQTKFNEWGTDTLKHHISSNNLDLAFMYTGDFFDILYSKLEDNPNYLDNPDNIDVGFYLPENTISFVDAFVITKKARHKDLAHKFIDFFLRPEVAYENASIVGYSTPLKESYEMILDGEDETWKQVITDYPYNTTYGIPLANLDPKFLTKLTLMINNIKTK